MNNTGELCVSGDDVMGQKAVVDIQGSGHMLYDPEIATSRMFDSDKEFLFCAGNLNVLAIDCFVKAHACNRFCHLG